MPYDKPCIIFPMKYQRETLIAALRAWGIRYLAPSDAVATEALPSEQALIIALVEQSDLRLQMALVPLFVRNPNLHTVVAELVNRLAPNFAVELQTYYMAAVYLQRLWEIRLGFYLDNCVLLPDLYSQTMGLPPAEERFGKPGLYDLAEAWKERSPYSFNYLASLTKTIDLFFEQLKAESPLPPYAPAS